MTIKEVCKNVYHIGVNDRKKNLFENMWPLPYGVAYNCYVINDEKTALLDTVELGSASWFLQSIDEALNGRALDYLIVNHTEPDHAGEIKNVVDKYPNVKIVGNKITFKILKEYYGFTENLIEVKDGDKLDLGHHKLQFVTTPMVHWPESMMTYDATEQILFSQDAFGSFGTLDGGTFDDEVDFDGFYQDEMRRYYSNIVGKFSPFVQKAFAKLQGVPVKYICPVHGILWRKNPQKVISLYDKWSRYEAENGVLVLFASMYGNTVRIADYIAGKIADGGVRDIRVFDVSKTHVSYLISEAWKYKGIVLGSCTYNGEMHPMMELFCREMEHYALKNRALSLFGTGSWGGGALKKLVQFSENIGWEKIGEPVEIIGAPDAEKLGRCNNLAKAMADKIES